MTLVRAIAVVLLLWSSTAWAATLSWTSNTDSDLAGYHVYQCTQLPCTRTSGTASSLATLGTSTSFDIGTPAVTEYYFVTAYDFANNESAGSAVATFTPVGSAPPVAAPAIGASPTSLSFTATQGGADPATQAISVSNLGGGTPTWGVSSDSAWMSRTPNSGTGTGVLTIGVTTGSLTAGTYNDTVKIWLPGATTSLNVPVTFTVGTAPVPPALGASPISLSFTATKGGAAPATQTLNISNTGGGTLNWTASDNATWLTLSRTSGTGNGIVTVSAVAGAAAVGTYSGSITLTVVGSASVTLPVTLTVVATAPVTSPVTTTLKSPSSPHGLAVGFGKKK